MAPSQMSNTFLSSTRQLITLTHEIAAPLHALTQGTTVDDLQHQARSQFEAAVQQMARTAAAAAAASPDKQFGRDESRPTSTLLRDGATTPDISTAGGGGGAAAATAELSCCHGLQPHRPIAEVVRSHCCNLAGSSADSTPSTSTSSTAVGSSGSRDGSSLNGSSGARSLQQLAIVSTVLPEPLAAYILQQCNLSAAVSGGGWGFLLVLCNLFAV